MIAFLLAVPRSTSPHQPIAYFFGKGERCLNSTLLSVYLTSRLGHLCIQERNRYYSCVSTSSMSHKINRAARADSIGAVHRGGTSSSG